MLRLSCPSRLVSARGQRAATCCTNRVYSRLGVLALGAPGPPLVEALARERLDGGRHAATAVLGVSTVPFGRFARPRGRALGHAAGQKAGAFAEAGHGKARVVEAGVGGEQRFEALRVLAGDLPDAPPAL